MDFLEGTSLSGDHFKADISTPESSPLVVFKSIKKKPDVYFGVVLEAAPRCEQVKVGDEVSFLRWDWQQFDLPNEKIIARERDLVMVNGEPTAGYIVFQLEEISPSKSKIIVPDTYEAPAIKALCGVVLASGVKDVNVGEKYIFDKMEDHQYYFGKDKLVFRVNRGAELLASYEKQPVLEVI